MCQTIYYWLCSNHPLVCGYHSSILQKRNWRSNKLSIFSKFSNTVLELGLACRGGQSDTQASPLSFNSLIFQIKIIIVWCKWLPSCGNSIWQAQKVGDMVSLVSPWFLWKVWRACLPVSTLWFTRSESLTSPQMNTIWALDLCPEQKKGKVIRSIRAGI